MEKETFEKYRKERYEDQMGYYDRKAVELQKKYKKFQWILIILSAITPVLAALNGKKFFGVEVDLQITVVATSAIVAILTSGLKTFQYQELWVSYRMTQELLKPEFYYYQFNVGPYREAGVDKESLFVSRVESILDKEHSAWPPKKNLNEKSKNEQEGTDASATAANVTEAPNAETGATDTNVAATGTPESNSPGTSASEEPKN